jgi:WD40 repeat protein
MKKFLLLMALLLQVFWIATGNAQTDAQTDAPTPITAENGAGLTLSHTLSGHVMAVSALAFHPLNSNVIVSTSRDLSMRITDIQTGETYLESYPHNAVAYGLVFSPDGEMLFTGSWDRTVKRYRLLDGYQLDELPAFVGFSHIVDHVEVSADGAWLGFGVGDGTIHILDMGSYNNRKIFQLEGLVIGDFLFFPTDEPELALFAVGMGFPEDRVLLGNFADDDLFPIAHGHANGVTVLATYPNEAGWLLITGGDDGLLEIWQVSFDADTGWNTPERLSQIIFDEPTWFTSLTVNPAGDVLVAGTQEGYIYVYDLRDPTEPNLLTALDISKDYSIQTVVFSADGTQLAGGGEAGQIFIWQP